MHNIVIVSGFWEKLGVNQKILIVFLLLAGSIGLYMLTEGHEWRKNLDCAELGKELSKEFQNRLRITGQDKTDLYRDEFTYSKKLGTCLYYSEQIPLFTNSDNELMIETSKILDASTNKEVLAFIRVSNLEDSSQTKETCISNIKKYECQTGFDFNQIKGDLFR